MADLSIEQLLAKAWEAWTAGDVQQARVYAKQVLSQDQRNGRGWLLVSYLTTDPLQQRKAIENAQRLAPDDPEVLKRERELARRPVGRFVPDEPPASAPTQPPPESSTKRTPHGTFIPDELPMTVPVLRPPTAPVKARFPVSREHVPTLDDGVVLGTPFRVLALMPLLAGLGGAMALVLVIIVLNGLFQNPLQNTPSAIVLRFYPALQRGDNTALAAILSNTAQRLCSNDLATCLSQRGSIGNYQDFSIIGETLTGQQATVTLRFQIIDNPVFLCQVFYTENQGGTWKIVKDEAPIACTAENQVTSTVHNGEVVTESGTPTPVDTRQTTSLAQTQLTQWAVLTLTARGGQADALNAAQAATQTQSVVAMTRTAEIVAFTTQTPVALTQVAGTATGQAMSVKGTLKGTLVAARIGQGHPQLVVLNADGSEIRPLKIPGIDPSWSPDGRRIAYTNREHQPSIHSVAADGSGDVALPFKDAPFGSGQVAWSPDGTKLVFAGGTRVGLHALFVTTPNGTGTKQLVDDSTAGDWPSWSPDGKQVMYTKADRVFFVGADGSNARSIATQSGARAAVWSPDGKHIAFDAGDDQERGVYTMNADGTGMRRLTPKTRYVAFPTWSPDGQHLAAMCYHGPTKSYGICIMDINGTTLTFIAENGFEGRIAWRP